MKTYILLLILLPFSWMACAQNGHDESTEKGDVHFEVQKGESEWRAELSPEEFHVLRESGTEKPFVNEYAKFKGDGIYVCAACGNELFDSETKFESGTGWPSFYTEIGDTNVVEKPDRSNGWVRTEVICGRCGGHLGHVFEDGPPPTGLRYCVNSASLEFKPEEK